MEQLPTLRRPLYKMKLRTSPFLLFCLLVLALGGILFYYSVPDQKPGQTFPATVNRDCAPSDGAAFTVRVPVSGGEIINISIWQAPEIRFRKTFTFPDGTGQVGNVLLIPPAGMPESLTGEAWFEGVSAGEVLEGGFRLKSESGGRFEGQFIAEWGNEVVYCG